MTFGERLKKSRQKKHLTQEELAQQIGVAKSTLAGYEAGIREPDLFKIKRLLEVLDVDSDYLLDVKRDFENRKIASELSEKYGKLEDGLKNVVNQLVLQLSEIQDRTKQ